MGQQVRQPPCGVGLRRDDTPADVVIRTRDYLVGKSPMCLGNQMELCKRCDWLADTAAA